MKKNICLIFPCHKCLQYLVNSEITLRKNILCLSFTMFKFYKKKVS